MTEQEFHAARRMFFVSTSGGVMIAGEGDPRSHFEWLAGMVGTTMAHEMYALWTRGYYLNGRVVAYKGQDFEHWINHEGLVEAIKVFDKLYGHVDHLPNGGKFVGGVKEVGIGIDKTCDRSRQPWEPKILIPVDEYLHSVAERKKKT
jgi:hypothetical protein